MIIEFELQGSKCLHKGVFDTTGFWVKYELEFCDMIEHTDNDNGGFDEKLVQWPNGAKIFSHFSFSFYHEDKAVVDLVYGALMGVLRGNQGKDLESIGYIRKLNK